VAGDQKNAGLENGGPQQLSDSNPKKCQCSTDISPMNVTYHICRQSTVSLSGGKPQP